MLGRSNRERVGGLGAEKNSLRHSSGFTDDGGHNLKVSLRFLGWTRDAVVSRLTFRLTV
jgi:hypothetical protein